MKRKPFIEQELWAKEMVGEYKPKKEIPLEGFLLSSNLGGLIAFHLYGGQVYKIGAQFGDALLQTDLKVKTKVLPLTPEKLLCIEFPDHMRFLAKKETFYEPDLFCHCVFVTCVAGNKISIKGKGTPEKLLILEYPLFDSNGVYIKKHDSANIGFFSDEQTLEEALLDADVNSTVKMNKKLAEFVVKCLLYIHSGDPDLREYKAPKCLKKNSTKIKKWIKQQEDPLIDMVYVGFDFKKPRIYTTGETWVETFPRWQPYGPQNSKVKLIWVKSHTRHYGANSDDE